MYIVALLTSKQPTKEMAVLCSILHNQGETEVLLVLPVMAPLLREGHGSCGPPDSAAPEQQVARMTDLRQSNQPRR